MNRYANKRMMIRKGGKFAKATPQDYGIGDACPTCNRPTLWHYNGDPREPHPDPRDFKYRCFTCEPKTEAELAFEAEIEASKPPKTTFADLFRSIGIEPFQTPVDSEVQP